MSKVTTDENHPGDAFSLGTESGQMNDDDDYRIRNQLFSRLSVNMRVFQQEDIGSDVTDSSTDGDLLEEAFNAFMRLQLVRKRASSLNNVMVVMRDESGDLSSIFDWIDIQSDTFNSCKVDRKKVKELQGYMFTPFNNAAKQTTSLPETITTLNLKTLERCIGQITDTSGKGEGKALFTSIMQELTSIKWMEQMVVKNSYNLVMREDALYVEKLKAFTDKLNGSFENGEVVTGGLLVFKYSLESLIDCDRPDLFARTLLHRHMPVSKAGVDRVLCEIKTKRRTRDVACLLNERRCLCGDSRTENPVGGCGGECQTAYCCFYNFSECHPFLASRDQHTYYFSHLYPHLAKLERLSKEMKVRYKGRRQFESISNMVFNILGRKQIGDRDSLYYGLREIFDSGLNNSSLSLGSRLREIHEALYLSPGHSSQLVTGMQGFNSLKVYDRELIRYLFCDTLQVGRLFQASTTFNYIIANTAPRYTIERIMLFNVTGPGEGKSYANKILTYQFSKVKGCIETLTSFTPQAFKYKQTRNSCVVIIDDAHITHEKNMKAVDRESHVIPNTFKNLLDNSVLESDVVTRDASSGKIDTVKFHAVHNCGFVWNTNTMGFVSDAWADRCLIMESEFPKAVKHTRSTNQMQDLVVTHRMDEITRVCLYRQNLIQCATMIAEPDIMQFGGRFDAARDACILALQASHIVCKGALSRRVSFCINQLVFAEAMKLACEFVFDIWIPPWTELPDFRSSPDLRCYMKQMNINRLAALNQLTFGQLCLETNAVYKLCTAACLPDICPRAVDIQGCFACQVLGYVLTQIYRQNLKTTTKDENLCISGIEKMSFSDMGINEVGEMAHEMLILCSKCTVPTRNSAEAYKLCTYRNATHQGSAQTGRGRSNHNKKVGSVTIPLEAVYDMMAMYSPDSHAGFWQQLTEAMSQAYVTEEFEDTNAFGQLSSGEDRGCRRVKFILDFNDNPLRSLTLEATVAVEPLNELTFHKSMLGGEIYHCSAPLYYGEILRKVLKKTAPKDALNSRHQKEAESGPEGSFHGPRLSVYSKEYTGVPVKHMSSFCKTRTVYYQNDIFLTDNCDHLKAIIQLEEDWEWKDATDVLNQVYGAETFSVDMLKRDYAPTMIVVKGEVLSTKPEDSQALTDMIRNMRESRGSLAMRHGVRRGGYKVATRPSSSKASHMEKIHNCGAHKRPLREGELKMAKKKKVHILRR